MLNLKKSVKSFSYLSILILILILTGCSRQQNRQIIKNLNNRKADFSETKNNIGIEIKQLNKEEFNAIFKNAPIKKLNFFFETNSILEVKLLNKTNNNLSLNIQSKTQLTHNQIKAKLKHTHKKTINICNSTIKAGKTILVILSGLFVGGVIFAINTPGCPSSGKALPAYLTTLTMIPFIVGTSIALLSKCATKHNRRIKNKKLEVFLKKKVFNSNQKHIIKKNNTFKRFLILEKRNIKKNISLELFNESDNKINLVTKLSIQTS